MAAKKKKSTTRSDTSLESLDLYTFFLDRASESKTLRAALEAIGARIETHRDYYIDDEDDQVWLPEVALQGWVIISQDQFNELERQAIRNAGGRAFLIVEGSASAEEQAAIVTRRYAPDVATTKGHACTLYCSDIPREESASYPPRKITINSRSSD